MQYFGVLQDGVDVRYCSTSKLLNHIRYVRVEAIRGERAQHAQLPVACVTHVLVLCALEIVEGLDRHQLAVGL